MRVIFEIKNDVEFHQGFIIYVVYMRSPFLIFKNQMKWQTCMGMNDKCNVAANTVQENQSMLQNIRENNIAQPANIQPNESVLQNVGENDIVQQASHHENESI